MNKPLISVLMPAYNAEKYISSAIESILNQSFKDFELIIIDDCSIDKTWKIIQNFVQKDKRIIAIRNKENIKSSMTYIKAMKLAKGKYIAIMDDDDISYPNRLEKQFEFLQIHPDVGIVGGVMEIIDKKGNHVAERRYHLTDSNIRKYIFLYSPFSHPLVMIRKSILDQVGYYNPKYAPADDYELYFRIGKISKFANLPDVLLKYRIVSSSITNSSTRVMELSTIAVRNIYRNIVPYRMTFIDKILTSMQYIGIYLLPSKIKIWLFNLLRNRL